MAQRIKPYLLTGGLVPLLENRHGFRLSPKTQEQLRSLESCYSTELSKLLSGREDKDDSGKFIWEVKFISDQEIEQAMRIVVATSQTDSIRPLVSFDDVYGQDLPNAHYHITRMQDPSKIGESPILSPRFNALPLELQARAIKSVHGQEIDLMDIGAFEGDTLYGEIAGRLKREGINVRNVNLVFAGQGAINKLTSLGVKVNYAHTFDWVDWLEIRDCMGFDGRKVKMPETVEKPNNRFIRYTERADSWASIPREFVEDYRRMYYSYFNAISSILAKEGIVADLSKSKEHGLVYELKLRRE